MRLRPRLVLATIAVTVPMVLGLVWLDARARHRAAAEALAGATLGRLQRPGERERCEAEPATWGKPFGPHGRPPRGDRPRPPPPPPPPMMMPPPGGGAPPVMYPYDAALRSAKPGAPAIPADLAAALGARDVVVVPTSTWGDRVDVIVRAPWDDGPCAIVYAHGTTTRGWLGALLPASDVWIVPVIGVLAAVLLAVGPVITRLRRLTRAVERSARAGFTEAVPVEGRDEISELARAFDAASREVRDQLAARDQRERALREFLADTTHDVMIPLTVLQGHLATLRERQQAGAPVEPEVLTAAMDEAHYLGALVGNLALVARLDSGELHLLRAPVDLGVLVARVIARHRPIARQRDVALEHAVPEAALHADADVTLLEQAVSNVVYNAIRHNHAGGHVAVILDEHRESDGVGALPASPAGRGRSPLGIATRAASWRLRVLDDGPGIPPDELSRLVERGFRGDAARTRTPGGQGLGLAIAWRVAELHGLTLRLGPSEHGGLEVLLEGALTPA